MRSLTSQKYKIYSKSEREKERRTKKIPLLLAMKHARPYDIHMMSKKYNGSLPIPDTFCLQKCLASIFGLAKEMTKYDEINTNIANNTICMHNSMFAWI